MAAVESAASPAGAGRCGRAAKVAALATAALGAAALGAALLASRPRHVAAAAATSGFLQSLEARPAAAAACSDWHAHPSKMVCGPGVALCGVLVLETGEGSGAYKHSKPVVHGLWPETGVYGDSQCIKPSNAAEPTTVFSCYDVPDQQGQLGFEQHEWTKHGTCSGARDASDFFSQVCELSAAPLQVMAAARASNLDLPDTADQLQRSGFCVYSTSTYSQIKLSACAGADGRWKLADAQDFAAVCGGGGPSPSPTPTPTPSPSPSPSPSPPPSPSPSPAPAGQCVKGVRGPKCSADADCAGLPGCVRCAHSGYCTDVPLAGLTGLTVDV